MSQAYSPLCCFYFQDRLINTQSTYSRISDWWHKLTTAVMLHTTGPVRTNRKCLIAFFLLKKESNQLTFFPFLAEKIGKIDNNSSMSKWGDQRSWRSIYESNKGGMYLYFTSSLVNLLLILN